MVETDTDNSSNGAGSAMSGLASLPFTVVGVLAFVDKAAVMAAAQSLFGNGAVALAVTEAMWLIGVISLVFIALGAVIAVLAFLAALVRQDPRKGGGAAILGIAYVLAYAVGQSLFASLPMLVAFTLGLTTVVYAAVLLIAILGALVLIAA